MLGDGSTSYTGPQPHQLKPEKLKPGEKPPQFVVFSWDGALENDDHLFSRFRQVAKESDATMTFFLSGMYLLPKTKSDLYRRPQHKPGSAAISFPTDEHIRETLAPRAGLAGRQ
ncbi:Lipoprotein OS=Streptomyces antimycoticus OX=68175 GN=SANT12839_070400 PE=4 SV=1 [Streptomyces antimycoticus]